MRTDEPPNTHDLIDLDSVVRALVFDPAPPKRLHGVGDVSLLDRRRVAVVGTRQCSEYGISVTGQIARCLAEADVAVVSGLALGIDAAAHAGALAADGAAIAVVGSGLDVVYPRANGPLWREVERRGLIISEYRAGATPERWRFPARNRLIAALAEVIVVVESHDRGGSLSTAAEALRRDRPVFAVPGPIRSPASQGTNRLIADGAHPLCEPEDILLALGLHSAGPLAPVCDVVSGPNLEPALRHLLDAVSFTASSVEQLMLATGLEIAPLAVALDELERRGLVKRTAGWIERAAPTALRGDT